VRAAVERLAELTALAGGLVLVALVCMTCISIAGRALSGLGLGPVPGDYELVEIGIGFAVFASLPWCHLNRGHATVDLLARSFGPRLCRVLDAAIDLSVLALAGLLAWRLAVGMLDKRAYFETSFILGIEIWQGYALALVGAAVFCVVAAWRAGESLLRLGRSGR
jgi:TRAP-type C4-dicarboxylate transport system permease small subunit